MGLSPSLGWLRDALHPPRAYEERFAAELLRSVRVGDCVWDVGANVGVYAKEIREIVGPGGLVCAFEPAPHCYDVLRKLEGPNFIAYNLALGDREAELPLAIASDPFGSTHSLVTSPAGGTAQLTVRVARGDDLLRGHRLRIPNVIKIDVEGFEEEVISGLASTLRQPECRALFCEVHFGILDQRGHRHAPSRIEAALLGYGFATNWIDASHVVGLKSDQ